MDSILDYLPKAKLPKRIYHYTSQVGLLGILKSKSFWCTRIQFLNDSREFRYAVDLLEKALDARLKKLRPASGTLEKTAKIENASSKRPSVVDAIPVLKELLLRAPDRAVHVACFSTKPDSLTQWRGYCPGGGGFCLGFSPKQLMTGRGLLLPCVYDRRQQLGLVNTLCDIHLPALLRHAGARWEKAFRDAYFDTVHFSSLLKHPSFAHEEEWRIISNLVGDTDDRIGVRPGKLVPIPYAELKLVKPNEQLEVDITVGPNPEIDLALEAAKVALARFNCLGTVRKSKIPYREI